jgi:hypothetical protein
MAVWVASGMGGDDDNGGNGEKIMVVMTVTAAMEVDRAFTCA